MVDANQPRAYPTATDPKLIRTGELRSDENLEDHDLKQMEAEEHIDYVRKVLGIVTVQMALTFALCALASTFDSFGKIFQNIWVLLFSCIVTIACVCVIAASKEWR